VTNRRRNDWRGLTEPACGRSCHGVVPVHPPTSEPAPRPNAINKNDISVQPWAATRFYFERRCGDDPSQTARCGDPERKAREAKPDGSWQTKRGERDHHRRCGRDDDGEPDGCGLVAEPHHEG